MGIEVEAGAGSGLLEEVASAISGLKSQISQLPKDEQTHQVVTEAIRANGWQNANEAQYIANWLLGGQVVASSEKTVKISGRKRFV